jgi:leader peptidase (prepilin peptidase)/N-methyltransferase
MLAVIFAILFGLVAGVIVNILADELPYRRGLWWPTYPDGTRRPPLAWSGIVAFLFGLRSPQNSDPDANHARPHLERDDLSWRYPLTEIASIGLMLLAVFATRDVEGMTAAQLAFYWVHLAFLLLILVIDLELRMIYSIVTWPALAIALLDALLLPVLAPSLVDALAGAAFGFGIFYAIYLGGIGFVKIMERRRGVEIDEVAFGFGDVRLMTVCGALLGFLGTFLAMFITVILGAVGALVYLVAKRFLSGQYRVFSAIPYGPYIIAATIIVLFFRDSVAAAIFGW